MQSPNTLKIALLATAIMPWLSWMTPVAAQSTPPQYTITELPTGGRLDFIDINNSGQISATRNFATDPRAVLWSQEQWVELGTGAAEGTGTGGCLGSNVTGRSYAHAINDQGTVVGRADFGVLCVPAGSGFNSGIITDAAVFPLRTSASAGVSFAPSPGEIVDKTAWGINNLGQIVGESPTGIPNERHAVRWDPLPGPYPYPPIITGMGGRLIALDPAGGVIGQDNMVDLGTLGGLTSNANDINSSGKVVGVSYDGSLPQSIPHAFLHDGNQMQALIPPEAVALAAGCQYVQGNAFAINDSDVVVGAVVCQVRLTLRPAPFVYDTAGFQFLPFPTGAPNSGGAVDINNLNQIVGSSGETSLNSTIPDGATLWQEGNAYLLESLIPGGSGWLLLEQAIAINDTGQIVGVGFLPSTERSVFLLTPVSTADTTPPVLTVPGNLTAEAISPAGAAVTYTASATDNVDPNPTVACAPPSGSTFPLGSTSVNCTATDASGNSANGTFTVTVRDTTPPVLTVPANITTPATSPAGATVPYSVSAVDIADPNPTINCTPAAGSTFPIGTTAVACSATDRSGNSANAGFQVVVKGASAQITTLIAGVTSLNLAQDFKNSLLTKLQDAFNAVNAGNLATACTSLKSFIKQVQAQSGKKITVNQANQLITAANQIRAVLGCA